jgi:hypothetical protein
VSELAQDLGGLNLAGEKTRQQAARPTGTRQSRRVSEAEEDGDEDSIIVVQNSKSGEGQKKKKRQLGNKRIYTDEGIEQATDQLAKSEGGKNIRRMARGSG